MRPSAYPEPVGGGGCDDVDGASDGIVGEHGASHPFLHLYGVGGVGQSHPVVPEHAAGCESGDGDAVEQDGDVFLPEAAYVYAGISVTAGLGGRVYAGDVFYEFRIGAGGCPAFNLVMGNGAEAER